MTKIIHTFTEGATERGVGKVLWERGILTQQATPKPPHWSRPAGPSREGLQGVLRQLKGESGQLHSLLHDVQTEKPVRVLLVFDQEDRTTPRQLAEEVVRALHWNHPFWQSFMLQSVNGWSNLFEHRSDDLHLLLHVSNASVKGIPRRDFDGYILQLLQGSAKQVIAQALRPGNAQDLLRKAEEEIPNLMQANNSPWTHAKSWLYAYITVFQFRDSHVGFAKKVVHHAPEDSLRQVFASLIQAWQLLSL